MTSGSHRSRSSTSSASSNYSARTQSTAPTSYYGHQSADKYRDDGRHLPEEPATDGPDLNPRASIDTYASTVASSEELSEESRAALPSARRKIHVSDAIPCTPPDFAELFPSTRRLLIAHDGSTPDGNMNLRVDTEITTTQGRVAKMTLFHLRMSDLKERKFSLRRYCRHSGREVCHSAKKYVKPSPVCRPKRPSRPRSFSTALQNFGRKAASPPLRRYDSGYESDDDDEAEELHNFTCLADVPATIPTNIVRLEFGNYAQVQVQRFHGRSGKSYDFEYWGHQYQWQRHLKLDRDGREGRSYSLVDLTGGKKVAQIDPDRLSHRQLLLEKSQGGWIPPCSLKITDRSIPEGNKADLADVIVATGLIALTDDHIKRR